MVKAKKKQSKRISTRQRAKVVRKVSQFKRQSRRAVRKLRKAGLIKKKVEKDPNLQIPNSWPNKEQILRQAMEEREKALEERRKMREAARKKREWERANPEKVRIMQARAEAKRLKAVQDAKVSLKKSQQFSVQLLKVLPRVNCVVQVLDARAPLSGISDAVETMVEESQRQERAAGDFGEKTLVYILNKADLVPRKRLQEWTALLQNEVLLDDDKLKIKRRVCIYSTKVMESPLTLLRLLQTVWMKSATKHKIIAAVTGFSNVGKNSIIQDLEAASNIVSVHPSSAVPSDKRMKIPGSREVALVTLPPDSDLIATPPTGADVVYKQLELLASGTVALSKEAADAVASQLVAADAVRAATHFKVAKVPSGAKLLEALATKRGVDALTATRALFKDFVSGRLQWCTVVDACGKKWGVKPAVVDAVETLQADVLNSCHVSLQKALQLASESFATPDHKVALTIEEEDDDNDEAEKTEEKPKDEKYTLEKEHWGDEADMDELEELEELEEMEEEEEGEEGEEECDIEDDD